MISDLNLIETDGMANDLIIIWKVLFGWKLEKKFTKQFSPKERKEKKQRNRKRKDQSLFKQKNQKIKYMKGDTLHSKHQQWHQK